MNPSASLNSRLTQLAVGRHLPHRTVRARLTVLYGGLFLLSGAVLMAIAYALLVNSGFVFTLQSGPGNQAVRGQPAGVVRTGTGAGFPALGWRTHPSTQTLAHWRSVAQCMRGHDVAGFPNPTASVPANLSGLREISARDGAIFAIPATINTGSAAFTRASNLCGFMPDYTRATAVDNRRRTQVRQQLLLQSGIALAVMSLLSLGLGWLVAGRVLRPLEDAYDAQRQFVANASHELRAPLTRLRALSEVALASPDADAASLRRAHERVLASEQHLEHLIDGLLALTRGQAGLERRERLDLAALVSQAILAHESQLAGLDLDVQAKLDAAPTSGDSRLLERVIANLVDNAIRHNIRGGHLEVATGTRDRHAFVSIANTGPTIPPEQIERLFQPFQRLDGTRTHHNSGHGLGLSIVRAIVSAHNGELAAHARAEGGLMIEISLPSATGAASGPALATGLTRRSRAVPRSDVAARG
jgi:signal transduction histidine kinase